MNNYELTCLISSAPDELERMELAEKIKSLLNADDRELINSRPLNEVNLGYPIKDQKKAYMLIVDFKTKAESIEKIKEALSGQEQLLRFFLVRKEKQVMRPAKRQAETKQTEEEKERKIRLKEIDKKIEEILSPSAETAGEETGGNKQEDELK